MAKRQKGQAEVEKKNSALGELKIEYVAIDAVKANDYNPNRQSEHEFGMLIKSITEDGFTQPVIVAQDYTIVDGEHRWRAAAQIGMTTIPVVVVPMEAAQAKIATLRHNRARGSEDLELSVQVLRDLEKLGALDWAADSLDLGDEELNRLLEDIQAPEGLAGDDFSDAWAPDRANRDQSTSDGDVINGEGLSVRQDSTIGAITAARERETAVAAARTDEERRLAGKDRNVYRVVLTFTDDEAIIVKSVLGDTPAQNLLDLCKNQTAAKQSTPA